LGEVIITPKKEVIEIDKIAPEKEFIETEILEELDIIAFDDSFVEQETQVFEELIEEEETPLIDREEDEIDDTRNILESLIHSLKEYRREIIIPLLIGIIIGTALSFTIITLNPFKNDDNDLNAEVRKIDRYLASGDSSFIAYHVASKNEIIQSIRNSGNVTTDINGVKHQFTPWDILKPDEIRQASKFLTLHKIFFDASDNVKDKSYQRSKDYHSEFGKAFKLFYKTFDKNDDGKVDNNERLAIRTIRSLKI
jgi:hypothetical protein